MDTSNKSDLAETTESVRKYALAAVSESRYRHSVRVAETCAKLCRRYGLDENIGYFCGIAHDICKNMEGDVLLKIASRDGCEIDAFEMERPALLHGRAAAVKLREDWGVADERVLEAVANHTFGKVGMCDLAKILYVADKIEPGREHMTEEYMKRLLKMDLNEMTRTVVKESMEYLKGRGKEASRQTKAFYKSLKKKGKKNAT
ncbi:MAG: bis(5'-nucleosyl)-tetraphosphatase (symmetrical) YqeK [Treponemataceae bacterium]|nr:bis(5'-nucleosyl)-tetraphosphatase (symmetrical) YqeK [Treponemataceae bacterium]